ncbi:hypothetical protein AKJ09_11099 [Labilithrix luteola]|uniref:Uncharacterized protein n=1 Tax=Labilithrix luteola TaxID=1391654 RepID=A0A0K1QF85_9BACT|nr:hypothetical protein [Labilithrix luteola]AKV04436.1 hypothetical protein AKJ09_11099 [Labilithrix luteola]
MPRACTTPEGSATYLDDFYACYARGTYLTGMDSVFAALDVATRASK